MQQNGLNITQTQNISIESQTFSIVGNGANFTKTNITTKASHSAVYRLHEPGHKTFILIAFVLFATQAYAQTPSGGLAAVESQYNSQLGAVLDPLVVEMCDLVTATPIDNVLEELVEATVVLLACLELLMITVTGITGEIYNVLGAAAAGADLYGSSLPITDPATLFTAAAADIVVCANLAAAALNDRNGNRAAQVCDPILATASPLPTATATDSSAPTDISTPTNTGTSALTSTNISNCPPPDWPAASVFTSGLSSCVACMFSINKSLTQASICNSIPSGSPFLITPYIINQTLCQTLPLGEGLSALCAQFCDNFCAWYYLDAIIDGLGSGYTPDGMDTEFGCSTPCSGVQWGGGWQCSANDYCNCPTGSLRCGQCLA